MIGNRRRAGRAALRATAGAGVMAMAVPAALLASPAAPAAAHQHPAATRAAYGREQLRRDVNAIHAAGVTGVLAEVDGGRLTVRAGTARLGSGRAVPANSYIRIGSNTKTFVATVLLQLVAEGRVSLDDTVAKWLPGVVTGNGNDGAAITIRQLLQHTSGIYDFTEALPALATSQGYRQNRYRSATPEQLVALALRHKPLFKPGTSWAYSNTDYVLAGMIIAKATGRSWATEVRDRIVVPLGLRHTFVPGSRPYLPAPHADLYQQFAPGGPLTDTTVMNYTWADAAGAIVSTPDDLDRFFRALVTGRLLPPAQLAEMEKTMPTIGEEGLLDRYGLGLGWQPLSCGGGYWTHGGDVLGSSTAVGVSANGRRSVVVEAFTELAGERAALRQHRLEADLVDHALCAGK
jgi:D-alanyl-D-alanine carboxypeptidase